MYQMKRFSTISLLLAGILCGCTEENLTEDHGISRDGDEPVKFVMEVLPVDGLPADTKVAHGGESFETGDVIHVQADFTLVDGTQTTSYDCLELGSDGEWISKESEDSGIPSSPMMWPWDAEKATFRAYYLSHSSGILVSETARVLDELQSEADPLYAEISDVPYGGAVHLEFGHLCTMLTVSGLTENEQSFWLEMDGIRDAFSLTRTENELSFSFITSDASLRPGGRNHVEGQSSGDGSVTFYLAPGDYSNIDITYRYGLAYLSLTDLADLGNLEAGTSYTLQINPGSGNVDEADEEERWPDPDDTSDDILLNTEEIDAMLEAIHDGDEYVSNAGVPIIAQDDNGSVLLRNLDFQNNSFTPQTLPNGAVLDGNYHYIKNISGSALFSQMNGRVSNLGIVGGSVSGTGIANAGILSPSSSASAVMNNLRLKDISISVTPSGSGVCNLGALTGNSAGNVIGVSLGGTVSVTVESDNVPGRVHIGGLVGQSSGSISGVALMDDDDPVEITVRCRCLFPEGAGADYAEGDRYVGGLVGLCTGTVRDCTLSATVDASQTQGVLMYTGGLIGMLRGAEEGSGAASSAVSLSGSVASCEVTGGLAYPLDNTTNGEGRSYTGGLVGYSYYASSVSDCVSMGTVYGHDYEPDFTPYENSYYAIGGAFGQIFGADTDVSGVDVRGDIETSITPAADDLYFIGLFAGRADKDYSSGNTVNNSGGYDFTGELGNIHY
ncbi:MAG: fimbrillin family protein [Bacteroidetes bacterium]|uniref:Fimbrillin family protein n=1 Tax=Candidatus Cryptobacteroides merdigallinarum TaxID=2840770 RepID=A0A9D9ELR2_9BACT|nr:fimbrillin family protein [Candidatus Cryptobacteroides merdigallinarum]